MTDQALPNDILREVSKYWNGHRLLYTCRKLYASWDPENYLITEHTIINRRDIVTKYMPNGAYHGTSCMSIHHVRETVKYHRGQIVKSVYTNTRGYSLTIIINGWTCEWSLIDITGIMTAPRKTDNGDVQLSTTALGPRAMNYHIISNVALQDFVSVAQKHIANSGIRGECTTLMITDLWEKLLPHTRVLGVP